MTASFSMSSSASSELRAEFASKSRKSTGMALTLPSRPGWSIKTFQRTLRMLKSMQPQRTFSMIRGTSESAESASSAILWAGCTKSGSARAAPRSTTGSCIEPLRRLSDALRYSIARLAKSPGSILSAVMLRPSIRLNAHARIARKCSSDSACAPTITILRL